MGRNSATILHLGEETPDVIGEVNERRKITLRGQTKISEGQQKTTEEGDQISPSLLLCVCAAPLEVVESDFCPSLPFEWQI